MGPAERARGKSGRASLLERITCVACHLAAKRPGRAAHAGFRLTRHYDVLHSVPTTGHGDPGVVDRCVAVRSAHEDELILYYGRSRQGNPLAGSYSGPFLRATAPVRLGCARAGRRRGPGSSSRSTASTCEASSSAPRGSVFIGKNPWMSQSFPRAGVVLREIAEDPEESMIVITRC
jgi:hypothetical protein